jgi:hypothetical protein
MEPLRLNADTLPLSRDLRMFRTVSHMACFNSEKQTTKNKTYLCFFAFLRAGTPASVMAEGVRAE